MYSHTCGFIGGCLQINLYSYSDIIRTCPKRHAATDGVSENEFFAWDKGIIYAYWRMFYASHREADTNTYRFDGNVRRAQTQFTKDMLVFSEMALLSYYSLVYRIENGG